jgi:uncharacterized protein (TIGR00255 family)
MLQSMTGFGTGRARVADEEVTVELRSVNHKFCEVKIRAPRELAAAELAIQKRVKERLARGAVDVLVKRNAPVAAAGAPVLDLALAREYRARLTELARALWLPDAPTLRDVVSQPGVLRLEERTLDVEAAGRAALEATDAALAPLIAMRKVEGAALERDLLARFERVADGVRQIGSLARAAVQEFGERVNERVAELARLSTVDPQRLAQEVAFFAERTDVAEEMTRLASHLDQCRGLLAGKEPAGRKLDFLVQEMHREVNTTGAKSQHREIARWVVELKAEIERLREQVQNVE